MMRHSAVVNDMNTDHLYLSACCKVMVSLGPGVLLPLA
jgi:hypothetical protein